MPESRHLNFWGAIALVFLLIILKSPNGEGQSSIFGGPVLKYIEETSSSLTNRVQSHNQLIDTNTLTALSVNSLGQGGPETSLEPSPIQENSYQAYSPPDSDYIESTALKRNQVVEYEVQSGDKLSFIASDFGVSVNSIIWANNLQNADNIKPGQILKIPPVSGVIHQVKKGETLASIAKKYGADENKIIAFNDLPRDGQVMVGDELVIPEGEIKTTLPAGTSTSISTTKRFSYLPDLANYFQWPTAGFDWGKVHGRNGVDIANSCGSPIYAAAEGIIETADNTGWNGGFGKVIKINHPNGTETLYAHNSKLLVIIGQIVAKGALISLMGTTGNSTGCHLHFEVHGARNPLAKY